MNNDAKNYLDSIFGKQFDHETWISYDDEKELIIIDEVNGGSQEWRPNELQQAINDNGGDTKRVLIRLKNLLN